MESLRLDCGLRIITGLVLFGGAVGLGAFAPGTAAAQGVDFNANQQQMLYAIAGPDGYGVCPKLAAIIRDPNVDATDDEEQLFVRCNRVLQADSTSDQDQALQMLTAEEVNAAQTNAIEFGSVNRSNIASRLLTLRSVRGGATVASLGRGGELFATTIGGASGDSDDPFGAGRTGIYVQGYFGSGDKSRTAFEAAYDIDAYGITAGVDYRFSNDFVAGIALGYGEGDSDLKRDSRGNDIRGSSFNSDGVTGTIYGSWYGDRYYIDFLGSYGSLDHDSKRRIEYSVTAKPTAPPSVGDVPLPPVDTVQRFATGSTSGDSWGLGLGTGYDFGQGAWRFGPVAALNYFKVDIDGFKEKGAEELNLLYGKQQGESLQFQLGVDLAYTASTASGVFVPYANAVWISEQKNDRESFRLRYLSDPCARPETGVTNCSFFDVASDKADSSFFRWGIGVSAMFANGFAGFVDYSAVADLDTISYGEFSLGLRYEF